MTTKLDRIGVKKDRIHAKFDEIKMEMEKVDAEYELEENLEAGDMVRELHVKPQRLGEILRSLKGQFPGNKELEELFADEDAFSDDVSRSDSGYALSDTDDYDTDEDDDEEDI